MLGLHDEVDGHGAHRGGRVGDDGDLRRPREGRRHADVAGDLLLGQRHVDVAGPGDHVDGADRLGAVGHGGDGLGSTDAVHLVDPGEVGGGQAGIGHGPVGPWRQAQHHLADPGHAGGDGVHEHGRRVGGEAPRHVHAGPVDGLGDGADADAVTLVAVLPGGLGPVEVLDGVVGGPEGGGHVLGQPVQCPGDLGRLHAGLGEVDPVEAQGVLGDGGVAPLSHVGDDGGDGGDGLLAGEDGAGQQGAQVAGPTAEVEHPEGGRRHGPGRLPAGVAGRANIPPVSAAAELSSIGTALEELRVRVDGLADELRGGADEDAAYDLYDVERNLRAATRRINKARDRLS